MAVKVRVPKKKLKSFNQSTTQLMTHTTGPSTGNRRAPTSVPGSSGATRSAPQKGGGGNKGAGSPEVTAATAPTVTVSSDGTVTAEHYGPKPSAQKAAQAAVRAQKQQVQKVKRIVALVNSTPQNRSPVTAKGTGLKAPTSPKPKTPTFTPAERKVLEAGKPGKVEKGALGLPNRPPDLNAAKAVLSSNPSKPAKAAPNPRLKGTKAERVQARAKVQQAKKAVRASGTPASLRIGEIQTPEQERNARVVLRTGKKMGASRKELLSAVETGLVESYGFQNLHRGDADSEGWRQERTSIYGIQDPTNVRKGAKNFFTETKTDPTVPGGGGETAGQLAQTVQGSAFPERYEEHKAEAAAILKTFGASRPDPKAVANYQAAVKRAKSLNMKVGKPMPDVSPDPGSHTIKVKATAQAAVEWLEANLGQNESGPKIQRLARNFGLNAVTEPWCANLVSNNLARRGFKTSELPANPNYTPSYEEWGAAGKFATDIGTNVAKIKPGDVLAFSGQHTATAVGNGEMISGNFSNEVMRTPISEGPAPLSMIIRPHYKGGWIRVKETSPLPGTVNPTGTISESSAPAVLGAVATPNGSTTGGSKGQRRAPKVRLSAPQRIAQAEKTLATGDLAAGKEAEAAPTSVLDKLAKKYGA